MAIKIVSWNIEGRLTRFTKTGRGSPEHIISGIRELDGDVVFLAEASDGDDIEPEITDQIKTLGYEIYTVNYDNSGARKWAAEAAPNMKLLTRLAIKNFRQIRLGDIRNALVADIEDPASGQTVRIFGIHLDDRSEASRLRQLSDLLPVIRKSSAPTIVMGDFNAMYKDSLPARILRSRFMAYIVRHWPHPLTKDGGQRVIDMATGTTLRTLEKATDLREADPRRSPTSTPKLRSQEWMPSIRLVQIDHIFVSPGVTITNFRVGRDGGSDHRAISVLLKM